MNSFVRWGGAWLAAAAWMGLSGCSLLPAATEAQVARLSAEDNHVRIDETRVRGQTQTLSVAPKSPQAPAYRILPARPSADHRRDGEGQRVWNLLEF